MTDREKLNEILSNNATCLTIGIESCDTCPYKYVEDCYTAALVDHLLANGVVVREKGEWIHKGPYYCGGVDWHCCSVCGCYTEKIGAFCSKCGADMRKGENE